MAFLCCARGVVTLWRKARVRLICHVNLHFYKVVILTSKHSKKAGQKTCFFCFFIYPPHSPCTIASPRGEQCIYLRINGELTTLFLYMVSDKPFANFVMPNDPIIPCSSVPKGAEWQGKLVFTGFQRINGYGGSMTFRTATANEKGELVFQ